MFIYFIILLLQQPIPTPVSEPINLCNQNTRIHIDTVEIPDDGVADVSYAYKMGKYEITNREYAVFLNSIETDPNGPVLYDSRMSDAFNGGIVETFCSHGDVVYLVKPQFRNKPVNYVSFFSAVRFVNWLHNDQPVGEVSEWTTENGAYDLSVDNNYETMLRSENANFALATYDEWMKSAFYDGNGNRYTFAVQSNDNPDFSTAVANGDIAFPGSHVVNYDSQANWNGSTQGNVTTVGSCEAPSGYGTYDQEGNVAEWTEDIICIGSFCGWHVVGGSYFSAYPESDNHINGLSVYFAPITNLEGVSGGHFRSGTVGFRVVDLR